MDFTRQFTSTPGFRAPPLIPKLAENTLGNLPSSPARSTRSNSYSPCYSGASSTSTDTAQLSRQASPESISQAQDLDLLAHSLGHETPSTTADILDIYSQTKLRIMDGPRNHQGRDDQSEIGDLSISRGPNTPSGMGGCAGGGASRKNQPRYVDADPGLWWSETNNRSSSRASPASYLPSFLAGGGGIGSSACAGDGSLNSPPPPFLTGMPITSPELQGRSCGGDAPTYTDSGKNDGTGEPLTSSDSKPGLNSQQPLATAGRINAENNGVDSPSQGVPSSFGLQRFSNLSQNHYYWPSSRPPLTSPTFSSVQHSHNCSHNIPFSPYSFATSGSGLPCSAVLQPTIEPARQTFASTTDVSDNTHSTLATQRQPPSQNPTPSLQSGHCHNQEKPHKSILRHRTPNRAIQRTHHSGAAPNQTMSSAAPSSAHLAQPSQPQSPPILAAQIGGGGLSNDDAPGSAYEYNNGENYFAYCFDRGNGRYTRLIPADVLPPLMDIPSVEFSCAGMRVLPIPRNLAPTGRSINMQPVDFASSRRDSTSFPASLSRSPDLVQSRIDNIVATQPQPMPPTTPKRLKIYCDKWVHEGVCAFTQQGCKYKHEMPFDRETQKSLGLFHGLPSWWRKHQTELQRQIEASDASPTDHQALVLGSRSLNTSGDEPLYLGGCGDGYGGHVQTPLAGRRQHHSGDLSWRRQDALPMVSAVEITSPPTPPSSGSRVNKTFTLSENTDSSNPHGQRHFSNSGRGGVLSGFGGHATTYSTGGRGLHVGRGGDRSLGWGAVGTPVPNGIQIPAGSAARPGNQSRSERRESNKFASMNMFDQLSLDNPQDSPVDGDDSGDGAQLA